MLFINIIFCLTACSRQHFFCGVLFQELETKMAAQKLSGGLKISMGTYSPDDSAMTSYREVHSKEDHSSSDED